MKISSNSYLKGYKVKIYPTEEQKQNIDRTIEIYRAVYNIGLDIQIENHKNGNKYIPFFTMEKIFSKMRNYDPNYSWFNEIPMGIIREALADLDTAYKCFFKKHNRFPSYKSRKRSKKAFGTRSDRCRCIDNNIYISGIGYVNARHHHIPVGSRMYDTRITFDGYNYWYTCMIETQMVDISNIPRTDPVGIDVGIRNFVTTSSGDIYQLSDISRLQKRLKRQQKRLSKFYNKYLTEAKRTKTKYEDIPKSKNMQKKLKEQRKTYDKIRNKRYTDIHNISKHIVEQNPSTIVMEDIRVRELEKDRWFKINYPYTYFFEIRRQIEYKAMIRNIPVIIADSNYPSSQICSRCGNKHKIYSNKIFICPVCGLRIDRDLNAAYNLRNLAYQNVNSTYDVA